MHGDLASIRDSYLTPPLKGEDMHHSTGPAYMLLHNAGIDGRSHGGRSESYAEAACTQFLLNLISAVRHSGRRLRTSNESWRLRGSVPLAASAFRILAVGHSSSALKRGTESRAPLEPWGLASRAEGSGRVTSPCKPKVAPEMHMPGRS